MRTIFEICKTGSEHDSLQLLPATKLSMDFVNIYLKANKHNAIEQYPECVIS